MKRGDRTSSPFSGLPSVSPDFQSRAVEQRSDKFRPIFLKKDKQPRDRGFSLRLYAARDWKSQANRAKSVENGLGNGINLRSHAASIGIWVKRNDKFCPIFLKKDKRPRDRGFSLWLYAARD